MKMLLIVTLLFLAGCDNPTDRLWNARDRAAAIECWSGDTKIFSGHSSGRLLASKHRIVFIDAESRVIIRIMGNCVISYDD